MTWASRWVWTARVLDLTDETTRKYSRRGIEVQDLPCLALQTTSVMNTSTNYIRIR